jgi:uncharacterized protein YcnI
LWELFRSAGRLIHDVHNQGEQAVRRIATAVGIAAITVLALASPAFAHVTISPSSAPKGTDAVLTFVAPNESDKGASMVKLAVVFPQDHPIAEALTEPIAGWSSSATSKKVTTPIQTDSGTVNEAVDTVTWTAASGGGTGPGHFQTFSVSVGLPDVTGSLTFKAVQTYSDGTVVTWDQATVPGGDEPPNPAPVLTLTAGASPTTTPATTSSSSSSDDTGKTLGIIALIVGGIGLIIAVVALVRARSKATASTT